MRCRDALIADGGRVPLVLSMAIDKLRDAVESRNVAARLDADKKDAVDTIAAIGRQETTIVSATTKRA